MTTDYLDLLPGSQHNPFCYNKFYNWYVSSMNLAHCDTLFSDRNIIPKRNHTHVLLFCIILILGHLHAYPLEHFRVEELPVTYWKNRLLAHKAYAECLQPSLSVAATLASVQENHPFSTISFFTVLLQVFFFFFFWSSSFSFAFWCPYKKSYRILQSLLKCL